MAVTISEIAKAAGVSNAAVSRYLNGGSLSKEKREHIEAVVKKLGYRPNAYARTLRTKKTKQIGVIVPKINSNAVGAATAGISSVLTREGYLFLLANTDNDEKKELEYLDLLQASQVAGIILMATIITPAHEKRLASLDIPVVLVGQQHKRFPCVYHNDYEAARELDELVLSKGRRKLLFIGVTERDIAAGYQRKKALMDACAKFGIAESEVLWREGDFTQDVGYFIARETFMQGAEVDAIICATDDMAVGAIKAAKEAGRRVPEDVSVVGIGDGWAGQMMDPALTTAHYYYRESGEDAAEMILSLLGSETDVPMRQIMLGYELKIRGSM